MQPLEYEQGTLIEGVGSGEWRVDVFLRESAEGSRRPMGTARLSADATELRVLPVPPCGSSSERHGLVTGCADWDRKTWVQIRALPLPSFISLESYSVILSSSFLKWNMGMIMWGKVEQERKRDRKGEVW